MHKGGTFTESGKTGFKRVARLQCIALRRDTRKGLIEILCGHPLVALSTTIPITNYCRKA